jgi:hypothetical protein
VINTAQDLLRLMGKFLIHENVLAKGAVSIVDSPREGDVIQPFKKGTFNKSCIAGPSSSNSNKRPRLEATSSETGVLRIEIQHLLTVLSLLRFRLAVPEILTGSAGSRFSSHGITGGRG